MTMQFNINFSELSDVMATVGSMPKRLGWHFRAVTAEQIAVELDRRTPVGVYPKTSKHPGKARASHSVGAGRAKPKALRDSLGGYGSQRLTKDVVRREVEKFGKPVRDAKGRFATGGVSVREELIFMNDARSDRSKDPRSYFKRLEFGHSSQARDGVYGPTFGSLNGAGNFAEAKRRLAREF